MLEPVKLPGLPVWKQLKLEKRLVSFDLDITARCNNNCRHCYINLPAGDKKAKKKELSFAEIKKIVNQATAKN